jgi:NADH pyrophosphatase NudC (nudix superfamily)
MGETIEQALLRETAEELNITSIHPVPLARYKWESAVESELVFSFMALYNATPVFNKKEVDDGRFWSIGEIKKNIGTNIFTPNFENEFPIILKALNNRK